MRMTPARALIFLLLASSACQARTIVVQESNVSKNRMCFGTTRITCNVIWAALAVAAVILMISLCFLVNCLCGSRRVSRTETIPLPEAPRRAKSIDSMTTIV
ncbi:hypothetical protein C8J56DRAFT_1162409 [Mycena floridula]|nr:hypothetical protein C8J56DRAFT_1162409 [Mycena floridula]